MEQREIDGSFFEMPTIQRRETTAGQSLLAESRGLFEFANEINDAHDLFPNQWCKHAATIVMKHALAKSEPVNRLTEQSMCMGA